MNLNESTAVLDFFNLVLFRMACAGAWLESS